MTISDTPQCYSCPVLLTPEPDGGFSVRAATLPGAASQGETEADALAGIREAIEGCLASYKVHSEPVPWAEEEAPAEGDLRRTVQAHV